MQDSNIRVLYAVGPGNVVDGYRFWKQRTEVPSVTSVAFSHTFIDWCEKVQAQAHLISCNEKREIIRDGRYVIENRPRPAWYWRNGLKHHLAAITCGLSVVMTAFREKPDVLILDSGTTHWIVTSLASAARIPVIAVLHSALWPAGFLPTRAVERILLKLDGVFFRKFAAATVCVSPECERQVRTVARTPRGPLFQCRAQFRPGYLDKASATPPHQQRPFRVLFVGRVEESKGVFLILSIAEELEQQMPGQFTWKIVGSGSASAELKRQVELRNLTHLVELTGLLEREDIRKAYGWAHVTIVPTTSRFNEGLAMTAAESVLAGRPVVLSTVVPAWEVLGDAAIAVPPDQAGGFIDALRELAQNPAYYDRCCAATATAQAQFYDSSQSLGSVLGHAVSTMLAARDVAELRG